MTADQPAAPFDLAQMVGGRRGVVDMSIPGVSLVVIDTFAPLRWAIVGALGAAAIVALIRLLRADPLRQAGMGLLGLAGAAALAAVTGDAKTYFLPGILANAGYAVLTITSIVVGRPLLGYVIALIDRGYSHWREDPELRRAATMATAMWATVFTVRAVVQGYLYAHGQTDWLAPARLGLGLPLWFLAVAGTLFVLEGRRREELAVEEHRHDAVRVEDFRHGDVSRKTSTDELDS
jgi:hypothetical protein